MYSKILVPLDGSEIAQKSLPYASQLAVKSGAELILFHVCGPEECNCGPETCYIQPMHNSYIQYTADVLRNTLQDSVDTVCKI